MGHPFWHSPDVERLLSLFQEKNFAGNLSEENSVHDNEAVVLEERVRNEMSVIEWFGTLILVAIPLVNLIFVLFNIYSPSLLKK